MDESVGSVTRVDFQKKPEAASENVEVASLAEDTPEEPKETVMAKDFNLDVDSPHKVADVLRRAAQKYYDMASEMAAKSLDAKLARLWSDLGKALDAAADQAEQLAARYF